MTGQTSICRALCMVAIALPLASAAQGADRPTAIRTFVSGLGNDANTSALCARAQPCRTLAAAATVTESGGEIIALDAADYGPISIAGTLSLFGTQDALIGVANGGTGVTINAPAADRIIIRDFIISGAGATNTVGIALNGGQLILENSSLKALRTGLTVVNTHADVIHSDFIGNGTAIVTEGPGVNTSTGNPPYTGTKTLVRLNGGNIIDNTTALQMQNATGDTNSNCEPTFWGFATGAALTNTNITGYTYLLSVSPSNPPYNCGLQYFYTQNGSPAPN